MNQFLKRTLQGDRVVWMIYILLIAISVVEMFSASSALIYRTGSIQGPIYSHVKHLVEGFAIILVAQVCGVRLIRVGGYLMLAAMLVMLVYVQFNGIEQAGAARFAKVGGLQFQPSEFAKLGIIIMMADQIDRCSQDKNSERLRFPVMLIVLLSVCGLIFLENLSTAAIIFCVVIGMMLIGGISKKKIFATLGGVVGAVALIIAIAWIIPESVYHESRNPVIGLFGRAYTWVARIDNFVNGEEGVESKYIVTDDNYQEAHAQMAIARGGFLPSWPGTSVERNYLPEAFSDFIYAIIVEEGGFFIGLVVIMLYMGLLFRAGVVAYRSETLFSALLVIGATLLIVFQAFIHIGVSVHLGPVTGQPLPLISRGGSSIWVTSAFIGLIINVTRQIQNSERQKEGLEPIPIIADGSIPGEGSADPLGSGKSDTDKNAEGESTIELIK